LGFSLPPKLREGAVREGGAKRRRHAGPRGQAGHTGTPTTSQGGERIAVAPHREEKEPGIRGAEARTATTSRGRNATT
jgi:hypothetical protein